MRTPSRLCLAGTLVAALVAPAPARAAPVPGDTPSIDAHVDATGTATIVVELRDRALGLRVADFALRVHDDASGDVIATFPASKVETFRTSNEPMTLAILVQESLLAAPEIAAAVGRIAEERRHDTRVDLLAYGTDAHVIVTDGEPGQMRAAAKAHAADHAPPAPGSDVPVPALGKGIAAAVRVLEQHEGRRALFIIGDGRDGRPDADGRQLRGVLRKARVETAFVQYPAADPSNPSARLAIALAGRNRVEVAASIEQIPQLAWILRVALNDLYTVEFPVTARDVPVLFTGVDRPVGVVVNGDELDPVSVSFPRPAPEVVTLAGGGSHRGLGLGLTAAAFALLLGLWWAARRRSRGANATTLSVRPPPAPASPAARSVAELVTLTGPDQGRKFRLADGRNVIGRAADCDIRLNDPSVSSHHAVLVASGGAFFVLDTGSRTGVIVGTNRVKAWRLGDRGTFMCGLTALRLEQGSGARN